MEGRKGWSNEQGELLVKSTGSPNFSPLTHPFAPSLTYSFTPHSLSLHSLTPHTLSHSTHTLLHSLFSFSLWFDLAGAQTRHSAVECWSPQSPHPCFGFGVGLSLFFLPLLAFAFTCLFDSWALNCRKMTVPTPHF